MLTYNCIARQKDDIFVKMFGQQIMHRQAFIQSRITTREKESLREGLFFYMTLLDVLGGAGNLRPEKGHRRKENLRYINGPSGPFLFIRYIQITKKAKMEGVI